MGQRFHSCGQSRATVNKNRLVIRTISELTRELVLTNYDTSTLQLEATT